MRLTIKLNIGNYQSIDCETNECDHINDCYHELYEFLTGWLGYTENAQKLRNNIEGFLRL